MPVVSPIQPGDEFAPPVLLYPSWIDSLFVTRVSTLQPITKIGNALGTEEVIPGDPLRWAIGFLANQSNIGTVCISLESDPLNYPFAKLLQGQAVWFALATYGPIVSLPWHVNSASAWLAKVYQVKRS